MGYREEAVECVKDCFLPIHRQIYAKYDGDFDRIYSEVYNSKSYQGRVIVFIKMVNQVSALAVCKRFCFPHTLANKLTGFLLFLTVPTMFWSMIPISIVAALATSAAVQEGHFIRTKQVCFESLSHRTIIQVPVEKA